MGVAVGVGVGVGVTVGVGVGVTVGVGVGVTVGVGIGVGVGAGVIQTGSFAGKNAVAPVLKSVGRVGILDTFQPLRFWLNAVAP